MAGPTSPITLGFTVQQATATGRAVQVTVSGRIDMSARRRALADYVTVSDGVVFAYGKGGSVFDTFTVSDAVTFARGFNRSLSDSVTATATVFVGIGPMYADIATATDTPVLRWAWGRTVADSVTATETMVRAVSWVRSLTDSVTVTESMVRLVGGLSPRFDTATATDVMVRAWAYNRTAADSVTPSESMVRARGYGRTLTDSVTPSESQNRVWTRARALTETVTPSDSPVRAMARPRSISDSVTPSESMVRARGYGRTLTDSGTPSEAGTWFIQDYVAWDYVTGDYMITSFGTLLMGLTKSLSDSVTPSDSISPVLTSGSSWTPAVLGAAVVGWWDASDAATLTIGSGSVSSWASKVGGITADNATFATQPTYSATARNGLPGVEFVGTSSQILNISSTAGFPDGSEAASVAVVAFGSTNAYTNQGWFYYGLVGAGNGRVLGYNNSGNKVWADNIAQNNIASAEDWYNHDRVVAWVEPAGASPAAYITVDGGSPQTTVTSAGTPAVVQANGAIGAIPGLTFTSGIIQEIVLTNTVLTTAERQKLEGYLAWKWGQQGNLDAGHPYKSAAPTTFWSPASYAGGVLTSWHDPSASGGITLASGNVSQDNDLSGNGYHDTQSASTNQPAYVTGDLNGLAVENFAHNGSAQPFFDTTLPSNPTQASYVAVINWSGVSPATIWGSTSGGGLQFRVDSGQLQLVKQQVALIGASTGATISSTDWTIVSCTYVPATGAYTLRINGAASGSGTSVQTLTSGTHLIGAQTIGGAEPLSDKMAERLTLSTTTTANVELAEGYLAHKYGLAANLDAGHPYKSAAP